MRRVFIAVLLGVAARANEFTWTGRVKLAATPEKIAEMLASEDRAVRMKAARIFQPSWADWSTESKRFRITYWQLDEDAHREAILESGGGGGVGYLIFDQDATGWWYVGRESVSTRGAKSGFRIRNWPDGNGPRCVVFEGASGWGTEVYVQGITVFRLKGGRLSQVIASDLWGNWMVMGGGGPSEYRYTRSFVLEQPHRFLVAQREIRTGEPFRDRAPLSAFLSAKVNSCFEHSGNGSKKEVPVSQCAQVLAVMPGID